MVYLFVRSRRVVVTRRLSREFELKAFFFFAVLATHFFSCCAAYGQFQLAAEIRPRAEYRHGFKSLYGSNDEPAFFVEQRSRLAASYQAATYKVGIVLQDVRIWGQTAQINKTDALTSVHEAWAQVFFGRRFSIKAGRQELVYDDHRILGNLDWAAQARSHDALVFKFADSTFTFHAGVAFNQDSKVPEPIKLTGSFYAPPVGFTTVGGGLPNYKNMQYAWAQKFLKKTQLSALAMNTGWQMPDSTVNYLLTTGLNLFTNPSKKFSLTASLYYQAGRDRINKNVNAWLVSTSVLYSGWKKMPITIGTDILTGSNPDEQGSRSFDPLFGTNHSFYGYMDYFYVGNAHAQKGATVGLVDIFAKTSFKVGPRSSWLVHVHEFLSQVDIVDPENPTKRLSPVLGAEVDCIFNYEYDAGVNIKLGYSQLVATQAMQAIKGGDRDKIQNWAWLMLTVKPTLFNTIHK